MTIINRLQYGALIEALQTRRVVFLSGPRQCGKTTLAKTLAKQTQNNKIIYRTLDDTTLLKAAENDPSGFLKFNESTMIIDEVQRAPSLILAIKKIVDEDNRPGQFLLTGSTNINALPTVRESLAGRIQYIRLRTLSQTEIVGTTSTDFLEQAFNQSFSSQCFTEDKAEILRYCFRGGYPEVLNMTAKTRRRWHEDYVQALIERDLKEIINIQRLDVLNELIKILCSWSGKFLDLSKIGTHFAINRATLEGYVNALEALFLSERIPSWTKTDYQRIGRRSKIFMTDSGLICSLLKWKYEDVLLDSDRCGKIFESFIYSELSTLVDFSLGEFNLYHYRDRDDHEIDFLIERDDGAILGIEVKAGSSLGLADFKHLIWFKNKIATNINFVGIVLYTGEHVVPFGANLWGIPIGHIWA